MAWQIVAIQWLVKLAPLAKDAYDWYNRPRCQQCQEDKPSKLKSTSCCGDVICMKCAKEAIRERWIRKDLFECPFCGNSHPID